MAAILRKAWKSSVSSAARGGEGPVQPTCGSSSSSASGGTILSTNYTTTSDSAGEQPRDFHPLSTPVVEEMNAEELDAERAEELDEDSRVKKLEHIRVLVIEFCGGDGNSLSALERLFSELDVGWVLHLGDDASAGRILISRQLQHLKRSWILALYEITNFISRCFDGWYSQGQEEATVWAHAYYDFVRFVKAIFLKMLACNDAIVALNIGDPSSTEPHIVSSNGLGALDKLQVMIDVRDALSTASEPILLVLWPHSPPRVESTRITGEMINLLSAELDKLDHAIWDKMEEIKTGIMSSSWGTPQTSPDIHKVTQSAVSYIKLLWANYDSVERVVSVVNNIYTSPLTIQIEEMLRSLEENLAKESQSFPDHSLRFLFLINNSYFIRQEIHTNWLLHGIITSKVDEYIQSYLQVCWSPVLKCLHNPTLRCFTRCSPMTKFELKFQKTYTAQKLLKVPDPELRKRLREAITEKVTSGFTKYLEDNNISTPQVTPQDLKEMLQELFEG